MLGFFRAPFGIGAGEGAGTPCPERRERDLRDNILDQLVTIVWTAVLISQEWGRWRLGVQAGPWPVTGMGAMALGYASWRLLRLVPRWRGAGEA